MHLQQCLVWKLIPPAPTPTTEFISTMSIVILNFQSYVSGSIYLKHCLGYHYLRILLSLNGFEDIYCAVYRCLP